MASFLVTLGAIIGSGVFSFSAANQDTCDLYAAVGQSLTLPFAYDGPKDSHILRWTHNSTIIFSKQGGRVSVGKPMDVTATGSLLLKNLQFSSSGIYQANLLQPNGTLDKKWTGRLCVMKKVSKPQLTYNCDFKSSVVTLNCFVVQPQGLEFSWVLDEKTLIAETRHQLTLSLAQLKEQRHFTCNVSNKVSMEKSDTVSPTCKSPTLPPLLCFPSTTVLAVFAGGAALILLLLTIIVILCCRHRWHKTHRRTTAKGEIRMLSLSKRDHICISPEYETMPPTDISPSLGPELSPRSYYENVSQPESQTENKHQPLSAAAEGLQPSPVPKPRTKSPYTANMSEEVRPERIGTETET